MPDIQQRSYKPCPYNSRSGISEFKIAVGLISPGDVDLVLPPAFLGYPANTLSFVFVDVAENPVVPGVGGLIRFGAKTKVNPGFEEAIFMGKDVLDIPVELDPITLSFAPAATKIVVTGANITIATDLIVTVQGFAQS